MTTNEIVLAVSGAVSLTTIIGLFVRLTWWLSEQFKEQRKLFYELSAKHDRRILRLEFWAVTRRDGFQPAADPAELNGGGAA